MVSGRAIEDHLGVLGELRISVFREYPYLYLGDREYEQRYLASYAASDAGLIVLALDGERVVGASTALPLAQHSDDVVQPLEAAGYPAASVYYFGESVLEAAHRGRGLGRAFFEHRERRARELGFGVAAFCAVERPADHPRRPADYRGHDALWASCGFQRRPDITARFAWRDLDDTGETEKPMTFWIKELG
ncbi:MAG TPA: GNAT family N-acetyltransferase [Kofleriaceae bacterium]|nr:GNAT family N-acetyltransferase [Kofleriaceae bacterium]